MIHHPPYPQHGVRRWDEHFLKLACVHAEMSKDPSTQVGAVIVGPDLEIRATGFNGFPRGVKDTGARLNNREDKLKLIVHAEMNAVLHAARTGVSVRGCTLYFAALGDNGPWGGPPCSRCVTHLIQAGIGEIVTYPRNIPERWQEDAELSSTLIHEGCMLYREVKPISS